MFFEIAEDIAQAETLPAEVYRSPVVYKALLERVFPLSWQYFFSGDLRPKALSPFTVLPGSLNEPLITQKRKEEWLAFSNVCTHRGARLLSSTSKEEHIRCPYHGRVFSREGVCLSMPEFDKKRFTARDDLPQVELQSFKNLIFGRLLSGGRSFQDWSHPLKRVAFLPLEKFIYSSQLSTEYLLPVNWLLYCDNYLEGLHIPFVHPELARVIDFHSYTVELFPESVLQIARARPGEPAFLLPEGHPDFGQQIAAYYFWLYPNLMLNFYPWGLSLNLVQPQAVDQTRIVYQSFVWKPELLDQGAGGDLPSVELEDQAILKEVQAGISSRLYHRGRYSVSQEKGVHLFHRLIARDYAAQQ